jgi:hypothetical protein
MLKRFQGLLSAVTLTSLVFSFIVMTKGNVQPMKQPAPMPAVENAPEKLPPAAYGKMPLLFEENKGQTDKAAKFVSRGAGYTLYLAATEAVFSLKVPVPETQGEEWAKAPKTAKKIKSDVLKMQFIDANANPTISGESQAVTKTNYYTGKKRLENLTNYRKINYKNLYDGIDAVFYGNANKQLEYDFTIAPNAETNKIALNFDGAESLSIDANGNLVVKTANAELVQQKPVAFQEINGRKHEVEVRYVINEQSEIADSKFQIGFALGDYDKSQTLTIDPALDYLTYIGGSGFDEVFEIAADAQGNAYFTGQTNSLNFFGETREDNDAEGAYVAKLNADGTDFVYITILEGNGPDFARGVALDSSNNAYVTGVGSHFFPTTSGAFDTVHGVANNDDVFVAKLNASGGLVYSTFLGGTDQDVGFDVAVDSSGKAYVVGATYSNVAFPQKNRYQGCGFFFPTSLNSLDAFLTVVNASGSDITYSTCIGGSVTTDEAFSVALDSSNNAYVTGLANGGNFPTKNAFQPESGGGTDGWVAKFNPAASGEASLVYSTYIGGSGTDVGTGVAVDANGQAVVVGLTGSFNFPLQNAFRSTNQINEGFVSVINSNGTALVNSSFLGGADQDGANNVALDASGSIYITGNTLSNDFPMALPFQAARRGLRDAFVAKVKFGRGVVSSSYLGGNGNDFAEGIAVKGNFIYVGGRTASTNLLTTAGVVKQATDSADGFVAKILDTRLDSVGVFRLASTFILTQSITTVVPVNANLTANLAGAKGVSGDWNGDGIDTIGSFTDGTWRVRDANFPFIVLPPKTITFGQAGDLPVVGDWNNDRIDTPGVYRPSTGQFLLTNSTSTIPPVEITVIFGIAEDLPIGGDWNADGFDSVGVFRPSSGQFFLTDDNVLTPNIDQTFFFGTTGDLPTAGDWNGNGVDTVGVWRPSTTEFFLTNDNINISNVFLFGQINTDQPIAGDWDGRPLP